MDKDISRRVFLERAALLGGVIASVSVDAGQQPAARQGPSRWEPAALMTVAAMAAQIIPADKTAGAEDAVVVDYIKAQVEASDTLMKMYAAGVADIDRASQQKFAAPFAALSAKREHEILVSIEKSEFFRSVRDLTVRGFYRSPLGWSTVGYPGMGQPHGHRDFDREAQASPDARTLPRRQRRDRSCLRQRTLGVLVGPTGVIGHGTAEG